MSGNSWLTLDNTNNANGVDTGNANANANGFEASNSSLPLPLPHPDHGVENDVDINMDMDTSSGPSKAGCFGTTRSKIYLGLVAVVLIIGGAAVGASLTIGSPAKSQGSSSSNSSSSGKTTLAGTDASGAAQTHSNGKEKLDHDSIGSNQHHAPSPTPANMHYAGRPTASPGPTSSTASEISDTIDGIARNGGKEFQDANSYQSRAKKWVLTQDLSVNVNDASTMTKEQQAIQLYVLACIYYATYSAKSEWTDLHYGADLALPGWYSSRGWLGSAETVCSDWHGLTCDDQGRILKIELDTNGLTGAFPPEVALLHETLNTIDLYNNMVHNVGDEGNNFLGELTNLEYLYLGTTNFDYSGIPSALGKLTALKELDVSYTLYFGTLNGAAFAALSNLRYLVIDGNAYNSPLPSELIQLPQLEYMYAGFSFLEDSLDFIPSMPKIRELWVDDNPGLKGTIPSAFGNLATLASFSASNCGIMGTIPTEIGSMSSMVQMWVNNNQLTGEIPSEIGNLPTLTILNLQSNDLVGEMSSAICNRRRPFGRLDELGADCDGAITCDEQCCTCCGDQWGSR
mmetsp:Transcript_1969/g.4240  ORF Transcript_1969/g.4240 Transcript_1969/m.4240 type:complete len:571 (-) Transcript_1969:122-1834(-)